MARALCSRSSVEAGKENLKIKGEKESYILLANGKVVSPAPSKITLEERICCSRRVDAHDKHEGFEFR